MPLIKLLLKQLIPTVEKRKQENPDRCKETIDVGDAQLVNFNSKEYIVWFEMKKAAYGHEIYVCQKELK